MTQYNTNIIQLDDSEQPLVSVVLPVFNSEKYIAETLDSILSQSYQNLEIVIVDDGSTDSSQEIIKNTIRIYPNIRYVRQQNAGVSAARNRGIRESKGRYIAFIDSDDLWDSTKIEKQIKKMQETGIGLCYCGVKYLFEDNGSYVNDKFKKISGDILIPYLKNKVWPYTITWILERSLIYKNDIWFNEDTRYGEDTEFFVKIIAFTKVCAVPERLAIYRIRPQSLSGYKIEHRNIINVWVNIREWIRNKSGRPDAAYCARIIDEFRIPSVIITCLYEEKKN